MKIQVDALLFARTYTFQSICDYYILVTMSSSMEEESVSEVEDIINFKMTSAEGQDVTSAFPWYAERTRKLQDPILRLHNEAIDFFLYTQPTKEEHERNIALFDKLKKAVEEHDSSLVVLAPFLQNKLYLKDTESDIYILATHLSQEYAADISEVLSRHVSVSVLPETAEKYEVFELEAEYQGTKMVVRMLERAKLEEYLLLVEENLSQIIEIKYIYAVFSCMTRQRWMALALRPYLLFALLSVFYHERRKHKVRTLTENIIKFIEYYGVGPFQQRRINYLGKNRYELLQEGPPPTPFSLWINEKTNIANPSVKELFGLLKNRYRLISNYNFDQEQSIIGLLVNPCARTFYY